MVSHCPLSFTMVGDDVAVVCDHDLFRNISSLPQYALAGKLLTEQRATANNKPNPGQIHLERSAITLRHRSSQASKGSWELL